MSTTLAEELEQAAKRAREAAYRWGSEGLSKHRKVAEAEADRLKRRAALIRAEEARLNDDFSRMSEFAQTVIASVKMVFDRIAGPLDAPTKGTDE